MGTGAPGGSIGNMGGEKSLEIEEVGWVFLIPCLFLPLPFIHTRLSLWHLHLCITQGQAQELPQVKSTQTHTQCMFWCQQPEGPLEWTLNWGCYSDGQKDKKGLPSRRPVNCGLRAAVGSWTAGLRSMA